VLTQPGAASDAWCRSSTCRNSLPSRGPWKRERLISSLVRCSIEPERQFTLKPTDYDTATEIRIADTMSDHMRKGLIDYDSARLVKFFGRRDRSAARAR
jgi:hypothetical protein